MIDYSEVEEGKVTGQQHLALRIITNPLSWSEAFLHSRNSALRRAYPRPMKFRTVDFTLEKLSLKKFLNIKTSAENSRSVREFKRDDVSPMVMTPGFHLGL